MRRRDLLSAGGATLLAALAGCSALSRGTGGPTDESTDSPTGTPTDTPYPTAPPGERVDDWKYDPMDLQQGGGGGGGGGGGTSGPTASPMATAAPQAEAADVGYAVGGAKDVNAFRNNIEEGYLPQPTDVSYEGLFYDYYFDTGSGGSCNSLFCPSYATAVTPDPLSGESERYLTVGLNSGMDADEFDRPDLDLVVVLDVSGSMSSPFDQYYYDGGEKKEVESDQPKIEVAKGALRALTQQLRPGDRFGLVLYNNTSSVAKPMRRVGETDMDAIRSHFSELRADGGTNLAAGLNVGRDLVDEVEGEPNEETRLIVLTDAMPNIGTRSESGLEGKLETYAEDGVHATFVGIGVDFNSEIIDAITSVRGANYYTVHSPEDFERRVGEQFEYMVTPMVYDLRLELVGEGYEIRKVYGSTAAEEATGEMFHAETLFPSPSKDGRTKGGVILAQVERTASEGSLEVRASWETRSGERGTTTDAVEFRNSGFANTGIRKAVLLSRYADLLKNWAIHERTDEKPDEGISVPDEEMMGRWEQQSQDLTVSPEYRDRFDRFSDHFESEMAAVGDDTLQQELEILERLATYRARLTP